MWAKVQETHLILESHTAGPQEEFTLCDTFELSANHPLTYNTMYNVLQ